MKWRIGIAAVIAVDTNILVNAHREDAPFHAAAADRLVELAEGNAAWAIRDLVAQAHVSGGRIHDAGVAALCRQHGVCELWSADRDFNRFAGLTVVNPLIR